MRKFDKIVVRLLTLLIIAASSSACFFFNPDVHYVLPDGYVGMFKIILDESNGIDVKRTKWHYAYEIPTDGILKVKSFAPLQALHSSTALYRDGTIIEIDDHYKTAEQTVALRGGGTSTRGDGLPTITMMIGTKKQMDYTVKEMFADNEFDEIPPPIFNERVKQIK